MNLNLFDLFTRYNVITECERLDNGTSIHLARAKEVDDKIRQMEVKWSVSLISSLVSFVFIAVSMVYPAFLFVALPFIFFSFAMFPPPSQKYKEALDERSEFINAFLDEQRNILFDKMRQCGDDE